MKAICLTVNPFSNCEALESLGRLEGLKKFVCLALRNYDKVYLFTMDKKKYALCNDDNFVHIITRPLPLPKILNLVYYYFSAGLKIFKAGLQCEIIRADGGTIEFQATIGSILSRTPLVMSHRYNAAGLIAISTSMKLKKVVSAIIYAIQRFSLKRAFKVITLTPSLKNKVVEMGVKPEKILVIPTPIDTVMFSPDIGGARIKRLYNLEGKKTLIYVGRLHSEKRLDDLVRAFKIINNTFPRSHLLIVGRGSQKEALKKLCDELGVSSSVTFVGPIKHELLPEYFAAADVFVLPSSMEGLPKALLEAMSMAKAIVATKVEGIANVVRDGENAMLFDVGNEGELATIVLRIFNDPLLESTLGMSARETIEREYAYEVVCHRYLDAINTYIISQG